MSYAVREGKVRDIIFEIDDLNPRYTCLKQYVEKYVPNYAEDYFEVNFSLEMMRVILIDYLLHTSQENYNKFCDDEGFSYYMYDPPLERNNWLVETKEEEGFCSIM